MDFHQTWYVHWYCGDLVWDYFWANFIKFWWLSAWDMPVFSFPDGNLSKCSGILTKLVHALILRRSGLGLLMGKFRQFMIMAGCYCFAFLLSRAMRYFFHPECISIFFFVLYKNIYMGVFIWSISSTHNICFNEEMWKFFILFRASSFISLPEQRSRRAIILPPALALALALALSSASTNVKVFVKVFKTSLFPNLITDLIHLWYDDTYWSKILCSTIPTTLGHVKVKVTDLEFSC